MEEDLTWDGILCDSNQNLNTFSLWEISFFFLSDFRERKEGRDKERKTLISCFIGLCIHWLILGCALTGDEPATMAYQDNALNQSSYPARA